MKKYWLYIEPFTFIFKGKQGFLFFNSNSNHHFLVSNKMKAKGFVNRLLEPINMYCIEISDIEIEKYELWPLVLSLRESFTGDLLDQERVNKKPIGLYPRLSIMKSVDRLNLHQDDMLGDNILNYLHEINIFITGKCTLNCYLCSIYAKQVTCCFKGYEELKIDVIKDLFHSILPTSIYKISFIGGDIFKYRYWEDLCLLIKGIPFKVNFYSHFMNIQLNPDKIENFTKNGIMNVIVPPNFSKVKLSCSLNLLMRKKIEFNIIFHIASSSQYSDIVSFCEWGKYENYTVYPVFIGSNIDFFYDNVFLDKRSILSASSSKKDIFAHIALNTNDFGKLNLMSNGDVYANLNFPKLGNIKNSSIYEILYSELLNGESWFRRRTQKPCNDCVYKWLCPSPSNYEIAIGKPNLCHVM